MLGFLKCNRAEALWPINAQSPAPVSIHMCSSKQDTFVSALVEVQWYIYTLSGWTISLRG